MRGNQELEDKDYILYSNLIMLLCIIATNLKVCFGQRNQMPDLPHFSSQLNPTEKIIAYTKSKLREH